MTALARLAVGVGGAAVLGGLMVAQTAATPEAFAASVSSYGYGLADRTTPWYRTLDELLPTVTYIEPDGTRWPGAEMVVVGEGVAVEPGRSGKDLGNDTWVESDFDDTEAWSRTVHVVIEVESALGSADPPDEVVVGFAVSPEVSLEDAAAWFRGAGRLVLVAPVGPNQRWGVTDDGGRRAERSTSIVPRDRPATAATPTSGGPADVSSVRLAVALAEHAEMLDEAGRLGHVEVQAEHADVDGDHLEAVRAGDQDARVLIDRLDDADRGVDAGQHFLGRREDRDPRVHLPASGGDVAQDERRVVLAWQRRRSEGSTGRHLQVDPVDPVRAPRAGVGLAADEVPVADPAHQPVRLDERPGGLDRSRRVAVAEPQPVMITNRRRDRGQCRRVHLRVWHVRTRVVRSL